MLWLSIILPVLAFMLFILVMRARRHWLKPKKPDPTDYDFSMAELHRLRVSGQISDEEFERARQSILLRKPSEPQALSKRGFEVLPARKMMIQSLEDRIAP